MKTTCILIYSLLLIVISSCTSKVKKDSNEFSQITSVNDLKSNSQIYVIPNSGCTGCINAIEELAKTNVGSDSLFFLFTRINSMKLFRNRFGEAFSKGENIILDTNNLFKYKEKEFEIYPVLYRKIQNDIIFIKYFKP